MIKIQSEYVCAYFLRYCKVIFVFFFVTFTHFVCKKNAKFCNRLCPVFRRKFVATIDGMAKLRETEKISNTKIVHAFLCHRRAHEDGDGARRRDVDNKDDNEAQRRNKFPSKYATYRDSQQI
jgi:hypothetical protein